MSAWSPTPELAAELDRVGVSYRKAGAADYVWALDLKEFVDLLGPPRVQPRPHWRGSTEKALALLAPLPDDAGPSRVHAGRAETRSRIAADGVKPNSSA